MPLHDDELDIDAALVADLLRRQRPVWADLPIVEAGGGTDNRMFRLGDELLARMPRTKDTAGSLRKEREWVPRLAPRLSLRVPTPEFAGSPTPEYPAEWAVVRWIDGAVPDAGNVSDWAEFGADLAGFVRELHAIDLMGATRDGDLSWYRGGSLGDADRWIGGYFDECRPLVGDDLDVDTLERWWREAVAMPDSTAGPVWLHGDLRPGNLLVRDGRLLAVIDFGALSVGAPDAEHAPVWDLPAPARDAYFAAVELDEATWLRARAWAIGVAVSGIAYYWETFPEFVAECRARLRAVLDGAGEH
ncbi:aminoglycoside phosphotransferase family protein [Agromyces endophyticus]|uniref:aminoglycoside phosphotransferase family protein n=1 Tax=Agromyces sp. H17E-10 TaxID=2932244 RepID=UPI001FD491D3|nr:aminoglycoside phosphotransferase family protein [Agromyces sp. H17E-10]UOQ90209.1 aminoglycoside phosphotransferase family protein [Agromyces sp. H17E-10]